MHPAFNISDVLEMLWDRIKALMTQQFMKSVSDRCRRGEQWGVCCTRDRALLILSAWQHQFSWTPKKNELSPLFLNRAMRNDSWWQCILHQRKKKAPLLWSGPFPLVHTGPLKAFYIALTQEPSGGSLNQAALHKLSTLAALSWAPMSGASD